MRTKIRFLFKHSKFESFITLHPTPINIKTLQEESLPILAFLYNHTSPDDKIKFLNLFPKQKKDIKQLSPYISTPSQDIIDTLLERFKLFCIQSSITPSKER